MIIRDLSTTGAQFEAQPERFRNGELVRLLLPFIPDEQPGEVVRTAGAGVAIKFCTPLGQTEVRSLAHVMQRHVASLNLHIPRLNPDFSLAR